MSRRRKDKSEDKNKGRNYITSSIFAILVLWIVTAVWPEVIPFRVFGEPFWGARGTFGAWVSSVWWIFAWGVGVNLITGAIANAEANSSFTLEKFLRRRREPDSAEILSIGTVVSLFAGVTEELAFRWLLYLSAIVTLVFMNWLWGTVFAFIFLGFLGIALTAAAAKASSRGNILPPILVGGFCGVGLILLIAHGGFLDPIKWIYDVLLVPLADFTTFHKLHEYLYATNVHTPYAWAAGGAIVSANAFFRDGHKYQGPLGVVNSWFIGMVFFWVMFTYGVFPAMVVHFLYDFLIFATVAFMRLFR